jgi:hypothetical protein
MCVACSGSIADGAAADETPGGTRPDGTGPGATGPGTGPGGGAGGTGGRPGVVGGPSPTAACTNDLAPVGVRRLTENEYNATIRDLFPGITIARIDLPQEVDASGFENRARIMNPTALLVEGYSSAAIAIAAQAVKTPAAILPCMPSAGTEAACGAQFVESFGARAFRRPLTDAEKKTYGDLFNQQRTAISFNAALQLTIEAFLQAPSFLYRLEFGDPATANAGRVRVTPYEVATRLSYLLWGSMPDQALFDAARTGKLATAADVETQARRMLKDDRLRNSVVDFHRQWLDFDRLAREPNKDPKLYPTYTAAMQASIREESDRFVDSVVVKGDGTVRSLLTSTTTLVDGNLAKQYGMTAPATGWMPVSLNPVERAGFLTRSNFLASHAHLQSGSPPLRAVFVMRRLLCTPPPPPPPDANTTPPMQTTGTGAKTNRQLFEERTVGACQGCHTLIDPLGFGLENYDAVGRYRTTDNGLPVNAAGEIKGADVAGPFTGGIELSKKLGDSAQVRLCMTGQWYEYALGRDRIDSDECKIKALDQALAAAGGNVRELLVALTKTNEFLYRSTP